MQQCGANSINTSQPADPPSLGTSLVQFVVRLAAKLGAYHGHVVPQSRGTKPDFPRCSAAQTYVYDMHAYNVIFSLYLGAIVGSSSCSKLWVLAACLLL